MEIVLGDARMSLESELSEGGPRAFDLFVLDAFTSDAIPVHLLTAEAFALYDQHLSEGGAILAHVSNRHLDIPQLLFGHAARLGMHAVEISNTSVGAQRSSMSRWVILTRDAGYVDELLTFVRAQQEALELPTGTVRIRRPDVRSFDNYPIWTDDYSNLFGLLRSNRSR
jgi:spermidine synthase